MGLPQVRLLVLLALLTTYINMHACQFMIRNSDALMLSGLLLDRANVPCGIWESAAIKLIRYTFRYPEGSFVNPRFHGVRATS
jgi:hypothetical protein